MRSVLLTTLAGLVAVLVMASPKPALALASTAALDHNQAQPSNLIEVRRYRRRYRRPYYRGRSYRRPYRYRRGYYRPYRYYNRPYYRRPYYRRRGRVSVYVGI